MNLTKYTRRNTIEVTIGTTKMKWKCSCRKPLIVLKKIIRSLMNMYLMWTMYCLQSGKESW